MSRVLCTGLLLLAACAPPASPVLPLQPEDFTLRGVPTDADSAEIRLTFGDPDSIVETANPFADTIPLTTWIYDGFEVRFGGPPAPIGYLITVRGERTARGASVGDEADQLLGLYGEPTTVFAPNWTWTDTTNAAALRVINAVVRADTVRSIYLGWALE
jgi:hypothetical protein